MPAAEACGKTRAVQAVQARPRSEIRQIGAVIGVAITVLLLGHGVVQRSDHVIERNVQSGIQSNDKQSLIRRGVSVPGRGDRNGVRIELTERQLLTALVDHPLGKRLAFVDPLGFADLPPGAASTTKAPRRHWTRAVTEQVQANPAAIRV